MMWFRFVGSQIKMEKIFFHRCKFVFLCKINSFMLISMSEYMSILIFRQIYDIKFLDIFNQKSEKFINFKDI